MLQTDTLSGFDHLRNVLARGQLTPEIAESANTAIAQLEAAFRKLQTELAQERRLRLAATSDQISTTNAKLQQEIAQRELIEKSLREKQACLQLLNRIAGSVTSGVSVEQLIEDAIDQIAAHFTEMRAVYGVIENGNFYAIHSAQPSTMPALKGLVDRLYVAPQYLDRISQHRAIVVEDVLQEPILVGFAPGMISRKTHALLSAPVQHSSKQIGLLCLNAPHPHRWSGCEIETIQEVADYLSIVLQKTRAQHEQAIAEARSRLFESVVINGNDGVIITDADINDPKIIYVNGRFVQLTGYTPKEVLGQTPRFLQGEKTDRDQIKKIRTAMSAACPIQVELINYRKDRSEYWVDLNIVPIADANGTLTNFVAMQRDITDRKWSEKALLATQTRLKYLLSSSPAVIYTCQPNQNRACTFVSENIVQQLGYEVWQYLKDPHFWVEHIHPDDLPSVSTNLSGLFELGELTCEYRFLHQDGSYRWLRDEMKLLKDANDKPIEIIGSIVDISERVRVEDERKRAEDQIRESLKEKEVMLKEIHHRVKNNLQVVSSLLKLQAGYIKDDRTLEVFKESQNRVRAMALIHEKLYQSEDLAKTNFAEYIRSLVNDLFRSYSISSRAIALKLDVGDVRLSIDTAIPCGLIINELVSNSLKYAFSTTNQGEIEIHLHSTEPDCYTLKVQDNGCGLPTDIDFRHTRSLGLQLVCSLVKQLHGTIELSNQAGAQFIISFAEKIRV